MRTVKHSAVWPDVAYRNEMEVSLADFVWKACAFPLAEFEFIPSYPPLNDLLSQGTREAFQFTWEWEPFQIMPQEYEELIQELLATSPTCYYIEPPASIHKYDDWQEWAWNTKEELEARDLEPIDKALDDLGLPPVTELRKDQADWQKAIPILLQGLSNSKMPCSKKEVVLCLGRLQPGRIPSKPLVDAFRQYGAGARSQIALYIGNVLRRTADDDVADDLIQIVQDERYHSRRDNIVMALGNLNDPRVEDVLIDLLDVPASYLKASAIEGLRMAGTIKALPHLKQMLKHNDAPFRKLAKKAIANIEAKSKIPAAAKILPITEFALVVRTDFSDDAAWEKIKATIEQPVDDFMAYVHFLSDPEFNKATVGDLRHRLPADYPHSFLIVADKRTVSHPEHPLLILDLAEGDGSEFRACPDQIQAIENNLSIANMGFEDFAGAAGEDGIFRGFM